MAGGAVVEQAVVGVDGGPVGHAAVAGVAGGGGGNVVGGLAGLGQGGAVARGAGGGWLDLGVVKGARRGPLLRRFVVAGFALVAGVQPGVVFAALAAGVYAVVAAQAVIRNRAVVYSGRRPGKGRMTRPAISRGDDMPGLTDLSFHGKPARAVVARFT